MSPRVALWVQTRLGLGHVTRARNLAHGLAVGGFEVSVLNGGMPHPGLSDAKEFRVTQLPPAQSPQLQSKIIYDADGSPVSEDWRRVRAAALKETLQNVDPQIVITETFPIGRRLFDFEWRPLLDLWRRQRPRPLLVSSVRDIVVPPSNPASAHKMQELAEAYDLILCHGDDKIISLDASCPDIARLNCPIHYAGYLTARNLNNLSRKSGIVVSAGGGAEGEQLYRAAIAARALRPNNERDWTIVLGPNFPADALGRLDAANAPGTKILSSVPSLMAQVGQDGLLISQAGYNTVVEALSLGVRLLSVPYETHKETEQVTRAEAFAARGWLTHLPASQLTPESLSSAIDRAISRPRPSRLEVDRGERACAAIWALWRNKSASP